ncbi:hypothetical protein LOAG_19145, partial [Loa loa]
HIFCSFSSLIDKTKEGLKTTYTPTHPPTCTHSQTPPHPHPCSLTSMRTPTQVYQRACTHAHSLAPTYMQG